MSDRGPNPQLRRRIDALIRVASPFLDLLLAVGDRVSRVLEPEDPAYVPARMGHAGESAPRGLNGYARSDRGKQR